jgi:hypothetical protein
MEPEVKSLLGTIDEAIKSVSQNQKNMQIQLDALELKGARSFASGGDAATPFVDLLKNSPQFQQLFADKKGSAILNLKDRDAAPFVYRPRGRKTTLTETGPPSMFPTSGVLQIDRVDGITEEPRQRLMVRDVLYQRPTVFSVVDFVKVLNPMTPGSPVPEGFDQTRRSCHLRERQ